MNGTEPPPSARPLRLAAWTVAAAFVLYGLGAMWWLSPRVPYADPWRFLATFLSHDFPADVLAPDNGHREVLPNALRVFELEFCAADQSLQVGAGIVLALLAFTCAVRLLRPRETTRGALAVLTLAAGMFWLGNGRKLTHGNESVHLFLIVLLLLLGLRALVRDEAGVPRRGPWLAALCGLLATFSFGSGLACFPAFALVVVLQGGSVRQLAPLALAAALATAGLLTGTAREPFTFAVLERVDLLLRWLGAGSTWALSPFLDPAHAARQPTSWLQFLTLPVAERMHDSFGPRVTARWPALAFGLLGVVWLVTATLRAHRQPTGHRERLALGVAWFGLCVGTLVVGLRVDYFHAYPKELTTTRYVPWSMLLWTGLVLVAIGRARTTAAATWRVGAFVALLLPSTVWMTRMAWDQRQVAELTALGAAVGVLGEDFDLVETVPQDLERALPLLQREGKAMFAWPETKRLGAALPPTAREVPLTQPTVQPVHNRFPGAGSSVAFHAPAGTAARLVLFDRERRVVGMAVRLPFDATWHGFVRGTPTAAELGAAAL